MKRIFLIPFAFLTYISAIAQNLEEEEPTKYILIVEDSDSLKSVNTLDDILIEEERKILNAEDFLDEMPTFPGGIKTLYEFLSSNVEYPAECAENNIQGKVIVRFTVYKNGSVGNVELSKSAHPLLDAEAMRVVKLLPNWNPGLLNGQPVNVWYKLPISFVLPKDTNNRSLSDSDKAYFDQFFESAERAESEGNINHAFQYYKECFNIKPWDFSLIDKIDQLIYAQYDYKDAFYRWALIRMMDEVEKNNDETGDYIVHMIDLQERLVQLSEPTFDTLYPLCHLNLLSNNFDRVHQIAMELYNLISNNDAVILAQVIDLDAAASLSENDYQGVVDLIAPKVEILLTQSVEEVSIAPFFELIDAYIILEKNKEAKALLKRVKKAYPNQFNRIIDSYDKISYPHSEKIHFLLNN